jgi:hypothetical protein
MNKMGGGWTGQMREEVAHHPIEMNNLAERGDMIQQWRLMENVSFILLLLISLFFFYLQNFLC